MVATTRDYQEDTTKIFLNKCINALLTHFEENFHRKLLCKEDLVNSKRNILLLTYFIDFVICNFIISPAIISFWRGTWDYSLIYFDDGLFQKTCNRAIVCMFGIFFFLESNCILANITCLIMGLGISGIIIVAQHGIRRKLTPSGRTRMLHKIGSRCFSLVWGLADIYMWRGTWEMLNCLVEEDYKIPVAIGAFNLGIGILVISGTFRSVVSVPLEVVVDDPINLCTASTFMRTNQDDRWYVILADAVVSIFLGISTVFTWYGLWTLEDWAQVQVFGHSHEMTAFISMGVSVLASFVIFVVQFHVAINLDPDVNGKCGKVCIVNFLINFVGLVSTVNMFRAYWYLMDSYLMPNHYELSLINGMIYGALILFLIHCGCTMHSGIVKDADCHGVGALFNFEYLTYFYIRAESKLSGCNA